VLQFSVLAAFLCAWEVASRFNVIDPLFASRPSAIIAKLAEMIRDGELWPHLAASGQTLFWGMLLAIAVGIPIGILVGRWELARATLEPFIAAIYSAPQVAFLPLLIIWLGIGIESKVALIFLGTFVVIVVNTETGIRQTDPRLIETAKVFTASETQVLRYVILPAALPFILAGLRLASGRALVMVVVAEIYAANQGLGYLIFQAGGMYDTAQVFVGLIILAALGAGFNGLLRVIEARVTPWAQ
jgi:ABC-type nitrate/sulfonate/bicarbonate transport system permease component